MKDKKHKVIIAGGGTGGHLFPAIAIGDQLSSNGIDVRYIGSKYGIEANHSFIDKEKIDLLDLKGIQRSLSFKNILKNCLLPIKIIKSYCKVKKIITDYKPDLVLGTGGYSSALPLFVAIKKKILTAIQEQNVIPGMVTKKFSKKVNIVFTSFKETENYIKNNNLILTGNPIRKIIKKTNQTKAKSSFGLNQDKFTILIIGGSQGAQAINEYFISHYKKYISKDIQIIWQIGKYSKNIKKDINDPNIKMFEFINDMGKAYSASNLVISRAGATAISEILYLGKASILIPYPFAAENHQEINAKILEKKGASIMVTESELNQNKLEGIIDELIHFKTKLISIEKKAFNYSINNSANIITEEIKKIIHARSN